MSDYPQYPQPPYQPPYQGSQPDYPPQAPYAPYPPQPDPQAPYSSYSPQSGQHEPYPPYPQPEMQAPYSPYAPQPGYPPYPQQPPKKSGLGKGLVIGGVVLLLVLVACGVISAFAFRASNAITSATSTATTSSNNDTNTGSTPDTNQSSGGSKHYTVGQTVKTGDTWEVTVNSVKTSNGEDYLKPDDGNIFIIINVTTHNISAKEQIISSLLNFRLREADGTEAKSAFLSSSVSNPPDGKVATGDKIRGDLVYQVPANQKQFTFLFDNDIMESGQTIWDINI
ncbi:hypothetical protein KSC_097530 [Ktedonobacter sp. SOSP1-52]|uniref:DUF4352 domain-containing protein n=1 Tax=Ktedonobacter sp. SOSP1-52 TaxID=2778366 RepID=UPI0019150EB8|nr:DUF4352 domain-containing protein [Ktedonobacter sp. SOSP1-52]GHO70861.1 hypothetical protein KSC_097530 [Ktedonobacter sp. SOSP1-52]